MRRSGAPPTRLRGLRARAESGAAAVEFGLIVIPMMVLVLGMIQYGWYFYVSQTVSGAASNVARRVSVGDCWGTNEAKLLAKNQAPQVTSASYSPAGLSTQDVGTIITVTVQADGAILDFVPMPNAGQITRTVTARLEDKTAGPSCP